MPVPEIVPITHEPGCRTATIGRYEQGQFFASVIYAFPQGLRLCEDRMEQKRLYAVLHRFDSEGRHFHSDIWRAGTFAEQQRRPYGSDSVRARAEARLAERLGSLPQLAYRDIAIRPFQVTFDGVLFGLVAEGHAEGEGEHDWAELYPDRLGFSAPWDGLYDT